MFTKEMLVSVLDKLEKAGNLPPEISENTALLLKSAKLIEELQNELQRLEAENKRLREALDKIRKSGFVSYDGPNPHVIAADALAQADGKAGE